ncbi:MAG: hypothetical protein JSS07_11825 [Proteobacteria bacterium]|nr:hypothetical protein [Pseudomonadota bacterium]
MKRISVVCCCILLIILNVSNAYASNKQQELKNLERLLLEDKARPENSIQSEIFKRFKDSQLLTVEEKSKWIEHHVENLSSPFYLLNAVYLSQQKQYQKSGVWYVFGSLRLDFDVLKCKDRTVIGSANTLKQVLLQDMDIGASNKNPETFAKHYLVWINRAWDQGLKLHYETPNSQKYPYYLANMGMQAISANLKQNKISKADLFVPEIKWKDLERKRIKELNPHQETKVSKK